MLIIFKNMAGQHIRKYGKLRRPFDRKLPSSEELHLGRSWNIKGRYQRRFPTGQGIKKEVNDKSRVGPKTLGFIYHQESLQVNRIYLDISLIQLVVSSFTLL